MSWGAHPPPYIKELGGEADGQGGGRAKVSPTPTGRRIPPFHVVGVGEMEMEKRREGRRGTPPLPLVQFGLGLGGGGSLSSLFPLKPNKAYILPGEFP